MHTAMKLTLASVFACFMILAGCRTTEVGTTASNDGYRRPVPAGDSYVPVESDFSARLNERLSTETTEEGERFSVTVTEPVYAADGALAIPPGAEAYGTVTGLDDSDHVSDQAAIRLNFDRVETADGRFAKLDASITDVDVETSGGNDDLARDAGVGAAAGAVLGAVIGGDLLDALEGSILGAGAGTAVSLGTGDVEASLPAGTMMTLETQDRIIVE